MRAVIQRVSRASVEVEGKLTGTIGTGLLVLLGVGREDTRADAEYLCDKIAGLRVFPDESGKMNRSLRDISGELLIVSQFTLYGDCRKGRRPSFDSAAPPRQAVELYDYFVECVRKSALPVRCGVFQAHMRVELVNDGPVTLICDSAERGTR